MATESGAMLNFSPDDAKLAFVSTSRDHKDEYVKVADTATGDVRDVYHEHVDSYYGWQAKTDWKVLWDQNEFLWASERSNWAQYLPLRPDDGRAEE